MDMHLIIQSTPWMNNIAINILNTDLGSLDKRAIVGAFVTFYWSGAMIGRFVGAYLTSKNNPSKVLGFFCNRSTFIHCYFHEYSWANFYVEYISCRII
jgi:FHS family L-fucose permease-like MFS transporter